MNLFDMMANAQNGQGMDALARQFNLSPEQTRSAVEALLPAFSQGLKRNASDPYGIGSFLSAVGSGNHAQYFENAQAAFSPQGMNEGNGILGHLFGSKDLSRAVAAQAAQATGIGQQVLQQMLPVIASMIMGGMSKQTAGQSQQAAGFGGSGNPLQEIIEQMMRQGGLAGGQPQANPAPQQPQAQPADPFDNPFGKMLKDMLGGGAAQPGQNQARQPEPQGQNPFGDNPLGKIFEEMLKGAQGGGTAQAGPAKTSDPSAGQSGQAKTPYDDIFGEMFETGRKQRDDYQKGVESIFDQFTRGMDRHK